MIIFWFGALILLLATLAWIVPALWHHDPGDEPNRDDHAVLAYETRLAELEIDSDEGVIDGEQFAAARDELARELLADTEPARAVTSQISPTASATVTTIATCAIAIGIYAALGRPDGLEVTGKDTLSATGQATAVAGGTTTEGSNTASIEEMVTGLAQRLAKDPSDGNGWLMLGRSYTVLNRLQDAAQAYDQAYTRLPDNPDAITGYAAVLGRLNNNSLTGRPTQLITRALNINPVHPQSLWLAGVAQMQKGNSAGAIKHWQQLKQAGVLGPEETATLEQFIAEAKGSAPSSTPAAATTSSSAPSPKSSASQAPASQVTAGVSIKVNVQLTAALADAVKPGASLFVFARAAQGPPMPLAVQRLDATALPTTVVLDESMAMMPTMTLATFPEVIVGARISATGNARATPGDLQGFSTTLSPGNTTEITVEISEVVQ